MTLDATRFPSYFEALWGYAPFPWQSRLVAQVLREGRYPDVLALGTGVGKTSIIDLHLFALAAEGARPPAERRLPRRLFFVVDRRVIVDQTDARAGDLARRLERAGEGILAEVAAALREIGGAAGEDAPFDTAVLRGGMVRDDAWARTPDRPLVVSSTVDQVGSRLLFRGYGVSEGMCPVHAGLVGEDALIVLDEVHLANPFAQTLSALRAHVRPGAPGRRSRWQVLTMSATPKDAEGVDASRVFRLDGDDRAHPVLQRRLAASRPVRMVEVKASGSDSAADRKAIAAAAVKAAVELQGAGHMAIGVVVNRVDIARDIWAALQKKREMKRVGAEIALVTGRMRPLDKAIPGALMAKVRAQRGPEEDPSAPVVIVSTQSIEAGADLDFDALVTQAASMDALRQRFGRLNRMGRFGVDGVTDEPSPGPRDTGLRARGVLLCPAAGAKQVPDPIYGDAITATVAFLRSLDGLAPPPEVDDGAAGDDAAGETPEPPGGAARETPADHWVSFDIDTLDRALAGLAPEARSALSAPAPDAPILLPTYVDLWLRTRPRPWPDPDVAPFLHGPQHAPDVQLVWRQDLREADLRAARASDEEGDPGGGDVLGELIARFEAVPPSSAEALSVPIYAVKAWLKGVKPVTVADVPVETSSPKKARDDSAYRLALRWRGDESRVIDPDELRVGDTLILPASRGGLSSAGVWDPTATDPVEDLGERAQWEVRGRAVLLPERHEAIAPGATAWTRRVLADEVLDDDQGAFETVREERAAIRRWLQHVVGAEGAPEWLREVARHLLRPRVGWERLRLAPSRWRPDEDGTGGADGQDGEPTGEPAAPARVVLVGRRPRRSHRDFLAEAPSHTGGRRGAEPVTLRGHLEDVAEQVRRFAHGLGLSDALAHDLALAGRLHDLGKADERFQRLLAGGDPVQAALNDEPLAKSSLSPADKGRRDEARRRSAYPPGTRHELASLALAEANGDLDDAHDPDLVRHLIVSHHGWCRPLPPPVADLDPVTIEHPFSDAASAPTISSRHGLARLGSGIAERFARLNERYGPHTLAWMEAILRLADHRASETPGGQTRATGAP